MSTETDIIRTKICPYLESLGARVVKVHSSPFSEAGVSDCLVCLAGQFCAFEVKKPTNKPTPIQLSFLATIIKAGGKAGVVYTNSYEADIERILSS